MITIPPLRNNRMTVELKELTIGQSIELAEMATHLLEASTTKMLRFAIKSVKGVDEDPINWTAQERMLAVSHYIACTSDEIDFAIGNGNYSDYIDYELTVSPALKQVEIGELGGDKWAIQHLTGAMIEAIEFLQDDTGLDAYVHFLIGTMAAQLVIVGEKTPEFKLEQDRYDWLLKRIETFKNYPESDFESLIVAYQIHKSKLDHFFRIGVDAQGLIALPSEKEGGKLGLPPTRFPVATCLSRTARDMARKPERISR